MYLLSLLAFVLLVVFGAVILVNNNLYPRRYAEIVEVESKENDVDPALIYAVIKKESKFDSNAVSSAGAVGLMQLMPSTAKWVAENSGMEYFYERLFDPEFNIKIGVKYLKYLLNKFSNEIVALCAYNAGEGVVSSWIENEDFSIIAIPYGETKQFVTDVLRFKQGYN